MAVFPLREPSPRYLPDRLLLLSAKTFFINREARLLSLVAQKDAHVQPAGIGSIGLGRAIADTSLTASSLFGTSVRHSSLDNPEPLLDRSARSLERLLAGTGESQCAR